MTATIFLLSPARTNGERAEMLARSKSALGERLRASSAPLGEVFAWLSALYFRGKLAYSDRFGRGESGVPGALVMAPGFGLRSPAAAISVEDLRAMGQVPVASDAFVAPLARDARLVHARAPESRVVLLGSIATGKYLDTLLDVFGDRLQFPACFVGRGDMSRGGLLLRASRTGEPLEYARVRGATLHGARPPKLPTLQRAGRAT